MGHKAPNRRVLGEAMHGEPGQKRCEKDHQNDLQIRQVHKRCRRSDKFGIAGTHGTGKV